MLGRGQQHVDEATVHMRPDGLALEAADEREHERLFCRDGKVVRPEPRQALMEGETGVDAAAASRAVTSSRMIGPSCSRNVASTVRGRPGIDVVAPRVSCRGLRSSADRLARPRSNLRELGPNSGVAGAGVLTCLASHAPRVATDGAQFVGRSAEAEAIDGDDGFDAHSTFNGPGRDFLRSAEFPNRANAWPASLASGSMLTCQTPAYGTLRF